MSEKANINNQDLQKKLLKTLENLNKNIEENNKTLKNIEKHEFLNIHRSKLKMALYNVSMGILFAIGTVLGLFLISWFTYHFLKDSETIKGIVDNQLKIRQFSIQDIKEKIKSEIKSESTQDSVPATANEKFKEIKEVPTQNIDENKIN
ncbi:hypothetical protein M0P65_00520 [Candidatus Gracilibacteria bacterium]|nr:hypothetical protein [Candidatus Gracilibacteria bacterium]